MSGSEATVADSQPQGESVADTAVERGIREKYRWIIVYGLLLLSLSVVGVTLNLLGNAVGGLLGEILRISAGITGALVVITLVLGGILLTVVYAYFSMRSRTWEDSTY
jgi:hypothetical protein